MEPKETWKTKALIIGGIAGLLAGIGAALIFIQRAESSEARPKMSAGEGVKVGISVLGVLKLISDLGTKK
ncbi:MAG TPA: hypothetical protein VMS73_01825 [Anaerolineaceae bacterium]|nr:hypothetical protein [Anaerolineaceae bacterium]